MTDIATAVGVLDTSAGEYTHRQAALDVLVFMLLITGLLIVGGACCDHRTHRLGDHVRSLDFAVHRVAPRSRDPPAGGAAAARGAVASRKPSSRTTKQASTGMDAPGRRHQ